jgi:hypothetical protein
MASAGREEIPRDGLQAFYRKTIMEGTEEVAHVG